MVNTAATIVISENKRYYFNTLLTCTEFNVKENVNY